MCLAIPMRVIAIERSGDGLLDSEIAIVEGDGIRREVRLDLVDRPPVEGDYLIIHAGFAIHTLDPQEARANLQLMREMGAALGGEKAS